MALKDQWIKIKDNWLLVLLVVVVLGVFLFSGNIRGISQSYSKAGTALSAPMMESAETAMAGGYARSSYYGNDNFAPEVEERKITKTASLSTEVERGTFYDAESKLKSIVTSSDSFILNEKVYKSGTDRKSYLQGSYQLKVETQKYDSVIAQLKDIGEVQSFNENAVDVTGRYTDLNTELAAEKDRLRRYQEMYDEAERIEDKINLNDRIFSEERTIKYLEDAIENIDKRVDYSTVQVTLTEKRSEYFDVAFVKFSQLIRNLVGSINSLFHLLFYLLPYGIAALLVWLGVRFFRGKKKR